MGHHIPQKPGSRVIVGTERSLAHHLSRALSSLVLGWISHTFRRRRCFSEITSLTLCTVKVKEFEGARGGTRMYYDLNVPYSANHGELQCTLAFLAQRQSF